MHREYFRPTKICFIRCRGHYSCAWDRLSSLKSFSNSEANAARDPPILAIVVFAHYIFLKAPFQVTEILVSQIHNESFETFHLSETRQNIVVKVPDVVVVFVRNGLGGCEIVFVESVVAADSQDQCGKIAVGCDDIREAIPVKHESIVLVLPRSVGPPIHVEGDIAHEAESGWYFMLEEPEDRLWVAESALEVESI